MWVNVDGLYAWRASSLDDETVGVGPVTVGEPFTGWEPRECGEHRSVGSHRAWCFDCSEWCYSRQIDMACRGCEITALRSALDRVRALPNTGGYMADETGEWVRLDDLRATIEGETT